MANWLRKILPKEDKFYPLFDEHADKIVAGAKELKAVLGNRKPGADEGRGTSLEQIAREGSETSRTILDRIRSSFVTPFDRADIKEMTVSMQAVLAALAAVAKARDAKKLDGAAPDVGRLGDLIVECADQLKDGIGLLEEVDKHADELREMRDQIGDARDRMAGLLDEAMHGIFETGGDPAAMLAGVKFLERIGAVAERFDSVADHIDDLVLDHV